jgi:hypothetical protein
MVLVIGRDVSVTIKGAFWFCLWSEDEDGDLVDGMEDKDVTDFFVGCSGDTSYSYWWAAKYLGGVDDVVEVGDARFSLVVADFSLVAIVDCLLLLVDC